MSSSFQTINWPADTYYTFTENNIIGGSLRYYGSTRKGAPLWIGSVEGLRTVHLYLAQGALALVLRCLTTMRTDTIHNVNEYLEIQTKTSSATNDVFRDRAYSTPPINGFTLLDPLSTISTAVIGVDTNIAAVTAHNVNINIGYATTNAWRYSQLEPQIFELWMALSVCRSLGNLTLPLPHLYLVWLAGFLGTEPAPCTSCQRLRTWRPGTRVVSEFVVQLRWPVV